MSFFSHLICGSAQIRPNQVYVVPQQVEGMQIEGDNKEQLDETIEGVRPKITIPGIPDKFIDPLTGKMMTRPYTGKNCHHSFSHDSLYSRLAQFKIGERNCPMNGCKEGEFNENYKLNQEIQKFIKDNPKLCKEHTLPEKDSNEMVWSIYNDSTTPIKNNNSGCCIVQ